MSASAAPRWQPTALTARAVEQRYGPTRVLAGVDLALAPSCVTAILGPNGAGKTTLLKVLAGLLEASAGEVSVGERRLASLSPAERARHIALVTGAPEMAFAWTALEITLMGRAPHIAAGRFESQSDLSAARQALARVDAAALSDRAFGALSAGEQQRVLIARALCQDTPILLLDEPTSHLDPAHALAMTALWRELAAAGHTVCWVVHDVNLAARGADQLVFMAAGRAVEAGPPAEVLTPAVIKRIYGVSSRRIEGRLPQLVLGEGEEGAEP